MKPKVTQAYKEFLCAVEAVLHTDWEYTRSMLGVASEEEEKAFKEKIADIFGEEAACKVDTGSFLKPSLPIDDACRDWGNRARLIEAYRCLKSLEADGQE